MPAPRRQGGEDGYLATASHAPHRALDRTVGCPHRRRSGQRAERGAGCLPPAAAQSPTRRAPGSDHAERNPPPPLISRYMGASNIGFTPGYNLGVSRAKSTLPGQDVLVILDFLYPYTSGIGHCSPDIDGTILATGACVSEDSAAGTVEGFVNGFMAGGHYPAGSHLTVAMGVSNSDQGVCSSGCVTTEFGTSWSNTVNGVLSYVSGYGWSTASTSGALWTTSWPLTAGRPRWRGRSASATLPTASTSTSGRARTAARRAARPASCLPPCPPSTPIGGPARTATTSPGARRPTRRSPSPCRRSTIRAGPTRRSGTT